MKLENKLQKTLIKEIAVIGLVALISLSGCGYHIYCPAYTSSNEKIESVKIDAIYSVTSKCDKQNYKLNN